MARKHSPRPPVTAKAVTAERATRLYQLLHLLGVGPQTRAALGRRLNLDVRGFYRDLELLRASGINLPLVQGRYTLKETVEQAVGRLPFPDPRLTLKEAVQLGKGRSAAHRKLREQVAGIIQKKELGRKSQGKKEKGPGKRSKGKRQ